MELRLFPEGITVVGEHKNAELADSDSRKVLGKGRCHNVEPICGRVAMSRGWLLK
jgi:hypothetical protein